MLKLSDGLPKWQYLLSHSAPKAGRVQGAGKMAIGFRLSLLWATALVGVVGLFFGFDLIVDALEKCLTVFFEFIQETLESMYRNRLKLDTYHAQMATAYTGFLALMAVGYYVFRKFAVIYRDFRVYWISEQEKLRVLWMKHRYNIGQWWDTLDGFNKFSVAVGLVLVAIPVLSIVCLALGKVVSELL